MFFAFFLKLYSSSSYNKGRGIFAILRYRSSEYCSFQNLERERRGSFDDEMNNKIRHKNPDLVNFAAGLTLLMIKF